MKVLSLSVNGQPLEGKFKGLVSKRAFVVSQEVDRYVVATAKAEHELSIAGGTYHLITAERKAGSAAAGAIVGGVLAGGVGLLAGGAMGAGTKSVLSIHHGNVVLVAEFSTKELAQLASHGVVLGAQAPGESVVKLGELRGPSVGVVVAVAVVTVALMVMCATDDKPKGSAAPAASGESR